MKWMSSGEYIHVIAPFKLYTASIYHNLILIIQIPSLLSLAQSFLRLQTEIFLQISHLNSTIVAYKKIYFPWSGPPDFTNLLIGLILEEELKKHKVIQHQRKKYYGENYYNKYDFTCCNEDGSPISPRVFLPSLSAYPNDLVMNIVSTIYVTHTLPCYMRPVSI